MTTTQKCGVAFIAGPPVVLVAVLVLWYALEVLVRAGPESFMFFSVANVVLGLVGILSVMGIIGGIPLGILLLIIGRPRTAT